ncbi:dihydrolipoyl dehydrogenase [Alkaliphilus peptidifermentans]|uniref:Dihydrolipoyl dehydrogenase n=1 Tax=Alkaliphilus peptidifermentans DSM 18978 TaxID=1120976 RepID=A0A1G5L1R1_9FIRM|nr:dihydrolipoyl dehydrogenase [Alkaliphilus peptidifermentans]SCZ06514.1 dihydrolipoamide dehydrogenase [Alkaliphilus peptidifermentans DSM 18978]
MKNYDIVVLGGGPGGYVAAIKAAQMGAKTALIEKGEIGGVCLNWGCIPTKALLKSAKIYEDMLDSEKFGIEIKDKSMVRINWPKMQERKDKVVKQLTGGVKTLLNRNGVELYQGNGEVVDKNTIKVKGDILKTKNLIIATGASPYIPEVDGLKEAINEGIAITSKEILELKELPKRLIIMGGGVISTEFAILYNALGVEVNIIQRSDRILGNIEKDIRDSMASIMQKKGITIHFNANILSVQRNRMSIESNEKQLILEGDKILISVGNRPNVEGLQNLGLKIDKKGISTNDRMETNIQGVYAIGDVNGKYNLAHVASAEGIAAVENILGKSTSINYNKIPSCIYGFPEVGSAGLTEEEAKEQGHEVIISTFPVAANGKALAEGESEGFIKIVADKKYGEVLGVHILAAHATDMIAEAVTTMELEGTVHELAKAIHPHPTLSEIVMEAAHGAIDKPIHIFKK